MRVDQSERRKLLALRLFLQEARWTVQDDPMAAVVEARPLGGSGRLLSFAFRGSPDILLDDDTSDAGGFAVEPAQFVSLLDVAALPEGAKLSLRIGRDLLFGRLFEHGAAARFQDYKTNVEFQFSDILNHPLEMPPPLLRHESRSLVPVSLEQVSEAAIGGKTAMIATPGSAGWDDLILQLFRRHANALLDGKLKRLSIPILLDCFAARSIGIAPLVEKEVRSATGVLASDKLIDALIDAGFIHIYSFGFEALRDGRTTDPNAYLVAKLLSLAQNDGSLTAACERMSAYHGPVFVAETSPDKADKCRPLGERFAEDARLELYNVHDQVARPAFDASADRIARLRETIESKCDGQASSAEVDQILEALSVVQRTSPMRGFSGAEFTRIVRRSVSADRQRSGPVSLIASAIRDSGFVRTISGLHLTITAPKLADALFARHVAGVFRNWALHTDTNRMDTLMAGTAPSFEDLHLGLNQLADDEFAAVRTRLPELLQRYDFRDDVVSPAKATLVHAILAMGDLIERRFGERSAEFFEQHFSTGAAFRQVALPNICFSGLDLERWEFNDCDLSQALFERCKLGKVKFKDCSLAGATFLDCQFSRSSSFEDSNMSAVRFERCRSLETALDKKKNVVGANWTTATIYLEKPMEDDVFKTIRLNASEATAMEVRGGGGASKAEPWPIPVQHAFLRAANDERYIVVGDMLVSRARFLCEESAEHWPIVREFSWTPGNSGFLLVSADGEAFVQGAMGASRTKLEGISAVRQLSHIELSRPIAGFETRDVLMAIWQNQGATGCINIVGLRKKNWTTELLKSFVVEQEMSALRWFELSEEKGREPRLIFGMPDGSMYLAFPDAAGEWQLLPSPSVSGDAPITAFGFSNRSNCIITCRQNGRIDGYRYDGDRSFGLLFGFSSAFREFTGVAQLNSHGQLLVVGMTEAEIEKSAGDRERALWMLLDESGRVILVAPEGLKNWRRKSVKIPAAEAATSSPGRDPQSAELIQVLANMVPETSALLVRPRISHEIEFRLSHRSGGVARSRLPESFRDGQHLRHRIAQVTVSSDGLNSTSRVFTEAEFISSWYDERGARVRLNVPFSERTSEATGRIDLYYTGGKSSARIEASFVFDLVVEWSDNPFVSDGTPVSGDQFFGFKKDVDAVQDILSNSACEHVIVTTTRRAGKTSFIRRVAENLRSSQTRRIAAVIDGVDVATDSDIVRSIQDSLREIGRLEQRRDFHELGSMTLGTGDKRNVMEKLAILAEGARDRGFRPPFAVFVDEWGYLKDDDAGKSLVNMADRLKVQGIALCLTSVPGDFPKPALAAQSWDYRFFSHLTDLSRLTGEELRRLIQQPLKARGFSIDDAVADVIARLSSGAPHDANIIMHSAFAEAKREADAGGDRRVEYRHFLPANPHEEKEALARLKQKYAAQHSYLLERMDEQQKHRVFEMAGDCSVLPTVDNPDADAGALWDRQNLGIPVAGHSEYHERIVFSEAGYRTLLEEGETDFGSRPGRGIHRLWIPWGLAEYFRTVKRRHAR